MTKKEKEKEIAEAKPEEEEEETNDKYSILEVTDKSGERHELLIAYAVESDDIPRFKEQITVPADKSREETIQRINDTAFARLESRREKAKEEAEQRSAEECIELKRVALFSEIENMKGTTLSLKKPKPKKKKLQEPQIKGGTSTH